MKAYAELLAGIPVEDKIRVFDALVREFQGTGKWVGCKRRFKKRTEPNSRIGTLPSEAIVMEECSVYEFVFRIDGHKDFLSGLLALAGSDKG